MTWHNSANASRRLRALFSLLSLFHINYTYIRAPTFSSRLDENRIKTRFLCATADNTQPSSRHELNALVVHHKHSKVIWTKGNKRLRRRKLNPPPLRFPQRNRLRLQHLQLHRSLQRHRFSLWAQDVHTPSWIMTTPTQERRQPSYTTRPFHRQKRSSMETQITWPSSLPVSAIELDVLIGIA